MPELKCPERIVLKLNCWEAKKCGRQPGGNKTDEFGICPAAIERQADGIHDGINGGRICWVITGTLCGGRIQGEFSQKVCNCLRCDFYNTVKEEEGLDLVRSKRILAKLFSYC